MKPIKQGRHAPNTRPHGEASLDGLLRAMICVLVSVLPGVMALAPAHAGNEPALVLADGQRQGPSGHLERLADGTRASLGIKDVMARTSGWEPASNHVNLGLSSRHWWFRLPVHNERPERVQRLLEIGYPSLDQVDVYAVEDGDVVASFAMGDHRPFPERPVSHRFFVAPLEWPADTTRTLYIHVHSTGPLQVPLRLWGYDEFFTHTQLQQTLAALFFGAMLIMGLYNFFIFLGIRERAHGFYVLHLLALVMFVLSVTGYGFQYLWPQAVDWNERSIGVFLTLAVVFAMFFTRDFLQLATRHHTRTVQLALYGVYGLLALMTLSVLLAPYTLMLVIVVAGANIACVTAFGAGFYTWWRGDQSARFYLLAWGALLAGGLILAASRFSILPRNLFTENAVQIGATLLVSLLSLAMAERINEERRRRAEAQRRALDQERAARLARDEALETQRQANAMLEQRVEERTRELAEANRQLETMSLTDALTELHNRRSFDDIMAVEYNRCYRYGHPLSLIFVDIDHFKDFNDTLGHQVGDSCLQMVGRVIAASASREADVAARYGGEEFCILLPETDLAGALAVAERVRRNVETEHFPVRDHSYRVTVSLGVSCHYPATADDAQRLLQEADQALYESKQNGRNQVTRSA
jgi:diguanylate cyclase (GGDEF)-like protein